MAGFKLPIMRNACRKDDSRGGIRQCANSRNFFLSFFFYWCWRQTPSRFLVICGKWESYPQEFAKCRRCRKAKYWARSPTPRTKKLWKDLSWFISFSHLISLFSLVILVLLKMLYESFEHTWHYCRVLVQILCTWHCSLVSELSSYK